MMRNWGYRTIHSAMTLNSGLFVATAVFGVRRYYNVHQQEDNIYCENCLTWYVTHSELQISQSLFEESPFKYSID